MSLGRCSSCSRCSSARAATRVTTPTAAPAPAATRPRKQAGGESEGTCSTFSGSDELTVGGTNFSEQEIVAEIYAQCLEAAGFKVDTKLKIGSREIVLPALEKGDIDLYPEYVGTLLRRRSTSTPSPDVDKTVSDLQAALKPKGLQMLEPAEAEDKNGFAVTKATADKLKIIVAVGPQGQVAGPRVRCRSRVPRAPALPHRAQGDVRPRVQGGQEARLRRTARPRTRWRRARSTWA